MKINKNLDGNTLTISLEGRLDTTTAPLLEEEIKNSLAGVTSLVMDFKALEYISSAGLRVLLSCQKQMNRQGTMEIHGANENIMEVFEVTGFCDILTIR